MTTIVTRAGKGSPLTNNEVDANFTNLNDAKIETLTSTDTSVTITGTGSTRDLSVPVNPNVVNGPASSTDNAVTRYDGTTGKVVQNSAVTINDAGVVAGASISGASNTLSNIANSALTNSAITINGNSTALGGSVSVGTVTSVTGTAPVVSTGGTTPVISMPAATAAVSGYMTNTYASKLDGIAAGATNVTNTNQLTNGSGFINSSGSITGSAGSVPWTGVTGRPTALSEFTNNLGNYGGFLSALSINNCSGNQSYSPRVTNIYRSGNTIVADINCNCQCQCNC